MIYFVRHGETVWNVENKICGATDSPLTELGHQQAIETAEKIRAHISEICGIPKREEPRLFEQNFGKYESTPRNGEEFLEAKKQFLNRYDGGESMFQLAQRIYNLLDELKADGKDYILVAHNGIARVVQSYFYEMTNEEYASFGIRNCEIREYRF